jgi:hypothetical protein
VNAETVLKILGTGERDAVYHRPLDASLYIVLSATCLRLFYLDREEAGANLTLWRTFPNDRRTATRPSTDLIFGEGAFANFLSNWSALYRERRWGAVAPSLGEVARVVNAYATATGYRLFTLVPDAPLASAELYAPVEMESMHEMTGWDS